MKKLLITACSLCLVAAIAVIGVFAFATQTFSINNRVSFNASGVRATVTVSGTNAGTAITFPESAQSITWDIDAAATSDLATSKTIPAQTFSGEGAEKAVVYTVSVANTGDASMTATVSDATLSALAAASNITVTVTYALDPSGDGASATSTNGATVAKGDVWTATFTYVLDDEGLNADLDQALAFTLAA